ncbi:hypothetical protein SAMN06297251_11592 [Fulvimarina manganoxydans]|uniref:Uncharacterized protein n=1 Tax=Fulvimarina manganoxydans TaxID=937218 RepID=A0A1W2DJ46_9HYPH|nr:hypothetical protein SAMN06297251_11592 [Fulvimarina manganoxydans]
MSPESRYGRLGRHVGMADPVRARHGRDFEARDDVLGKADFLVNLHGLTDTHHTYGAFEIVDHLAHVANAFVRHAGNRVAPLDAKARTLPEESAHPLLEVREGDIWRIGLDRYLRSARDLLAVDRYARRIRAAISHRPQHVGQELPEIFLKRAVL